MEGFIVNYYEFHFLFVTGIEHVESKSIQGMGLLKIQFHPGTNMAQAVAGNGRISRSRPRLHAYGNRAAFRAAVRRWQRAGRQSRLLQQDQNRCRTSGRRALQGAPVVCDLAGRFGASAVRFRANAPS